MTRLNGRLARIVYRLAIFATLVGIVAADAKWR
jgi:hypothetical protein